MKYNTKQTKNTTLTQHLQAQSEHTFPYNHIVTQGWGTLQDPTASSTAAGWPLTH